MTNIFLNTIEKYYRVNRSDIAYLRFIFEAYEGIAVISTCDSQSGIVVFKIPPDFEQEVEMVINGLSKEILIKKIPVEENDIKNKRII